MWVISFLRCETLYVPRSNFQKNLFTLTFFWFNMKDVEIESYRVMKMYIKKTIYIKNRIASRFIKQHDNYKSICFKFNYYEYNQNHT